MSNGEILLTKLNFIILYTLEQIIYTTRATYFYTFRDLDFRGGIGKFIDVMFNIQFKQDELDSLVKLMDNMDLSHLDLPSNYRALIMDVPIADSNHIEDYSKYEYSGIKLAQAFLEMVEFVKSMNMDVSIFKMSDYVTDLGLSDDVADTELLNKITSILNEDHIENKLNMVIQYKGDFNLVFPLYIEGLAHHITYLRTLIGVYRTASHKPNELPYIAIL